MITSNIRWEVRFEYVLSGFKGGVVSFDTRREARARSNILKAHPQNYHTVRIYRVNEFLDEQGNPVMTFHKRAR